MTIGTGGNLTSSSESPQHLYPANPIAHVGVRSPKVLSEVEGLYPPLRPLQRESGGPAAKPHPPYKNCINRYEAAPFGGYKSSGYGRDHAKRRTSLGAAALEQYTETKCVWVGLE